MNQLRTTGKPVFALGDMNDREDFFCPFVGSTTMHSASGGTATPTSCNPAPRMRIDWILGNRGVDFSRYTVDDGALVDRASDHPFVFAEAS